MSKPSTVVFMVPDYEPTTGGTTRQTRNLALTLASHGHHVTVVTQRLERSWAARETIEGIDVVRLGPPSRRGRAMKLLVLHVAWWLRRNRKRITVSTTIMYPDFVVAAHAAGIADTAVMVWAGLGDATDTLALNQSRARNALAYLRRRALRDATHIALSNAISSELRDLDFGAQPHIIPTPVDPAMFSPPDAAQRAAARDRIGVAETTLMVLYAGHLRALKRVDLLIEAFRLLCDSGIDAHLYILGGSREDLQDRTEQLQTLVTKLNLQQRVTFTGVVSDVVEYFHAADVLTLPSDREGISNSLIEALACGLPCIAPPSAGGAEVLNDECGVIPNSNSPHELFDALRFVCDPAVRARMRIGAAQASQRFALATIAQQYVWLYESVRAKHIG